MGKGDATVREDQFTVREDGATVREEPAPPTVARSQEEQAPGWLPGGLAANWRVIESLPARGGEADLYLVGARNTLPDAGNASRRVAKVYRHGIAPKEDVIQRVQAANPAHVVRLEDYGHDAGRWWELMEYVEYGSLRQLLEREGPKFPDGLAREILRQLNDALTSLHSLPLEHRDLKPANVLVRSREPLDLILTDFGISSVMDTSQHFTRTARTLRYAPPEAIGGIAADESTGGSLVMIERTTWDYWSLGMMLVEMLRGVHPYDGLGEAVITNQLATQNVDELTAGVPAPEWRKLCRGLLRRTPSARWDAVAVSKWIADPNDPSLAVAEEIAAAQPTATIDFDGSRYAKPADLGEALARDWAKAVSFWKRRFGDVRTWVTDGLGLGPLGDALAEIDDSDLPLETQVFNFIYHLAPNAPVRFRNIDLSAEGLAALGERAVNQADPEARAAILALHGQRILALAASLPEGDGLAELSSRWDEAINNYERLRFEFRKRGVTVPALDDEMLVRLLASSTPGSPGLGALREEAYRTSTEDARRCDWFRELGAPEDMPVAVLSMLPHLLVPAERQGKLARMERLRGCVGGIVVGDLFGQLVRWADGPGRNGDFADLATGATLLAGVIIAFSLAVLWYRGGVGGVRDGVLGLYRRLLARVRTYRGQG